MHWIVLWSVVWLPVVGGMTWLAKLYHVVGIEKAKSASAFDASGLVWRWLEVSVSVAFKLVLDEFFFSEMRASFGEGR